jgi:hypothetical protein
VAEQYRGVLDGMKCAEVHLLVTPGEVEPWFTFVCPWCAENLQRYELRYPLRHLLTLLEKRSEHIARCRVEYEQLVDAIWRGEGAI